jgi:oligopeptide transport system substrate-binding protein
LDPQLADTGVTVFLLRQMTSTLLKYDKNYALVGADAESWNWVSGGQGLQVVLKPDRKWSDGVAITACQYRDSIERALSPTVASHLADLLYDIRGAQERKSKGPGVALGVRCDDSKRELTIDTVSPKPNRLLHALAFVVTAPLRQDRVDALGESWLVGGQGKAAISSGAFVVESWERDRRLVLVARREHLPKSEQAQIDRVEFPLVRDPTTQLAMYESGELDLIEEVPAAMLKNLAERPDRVLAPYFVTYMVGFSFRANPVLKDSRVRRALAFTAHQAEVPQILGGGETEAKGWVPPDLLPESARPTVSLFNPELAKTELAAAGFPGGKGFPKLRLDYNSGERHQLLMERLVNNWKTHLGISVELNPMEWKVLVSKVKTKPADLYRYAWSAVYPDPLFFLELYTSSSLNNFGSFNLKAFDEGVKKLVQVPVGERGAEFWKSFQDLHSVLTATDPALIPIYHYVRNALVHPRVQGLAFQGVGSVDLSQVRLAPKPK